MIPERFVQLDLGILYLGMLQAAEGGPARVVELRAAPQQEVASFVDNQLAARGESYREPNWQTTPWQPQRGSASNLILSDIFGIQTGCEY